MVVNLVEIGCVNFECVILRGENSNCLVIVVSGFEDMFCSKSWVMVVLLLE